MREGKLGQGSVNQGSNTNNRKRFSRNACKQTKFVFVQSLVDFWSGVGRFFSWIELDSLSKNIFANYLKLAKISKMLQNFRFPCFVT